MKNTIDLTENFGTLYHPISALVFYGSKGTKSDMYVEHFEMDKNGNPINAHPLTEREAKVLARALQVEKDRDSAYLKSNGILPTNILHINSNKDKGAVLWYTKAQQRHLYFVDGLEIPNGKSYLPPMVWYANKKSLFVFALKSDRRPTEKTILYYAPFFNIYENGNVCMGTVSVAIKNSASVEDFTSAWEDYFFNSYFSHLMQNHVPIKGNCTTHWKMLIKTGEPFPKEILKKNNRTIKDLVP